MTAYLLPGVIGLMTGLLLHWAGFSRTEGLREAMGLRRSLALRSALTALGWAMALTALLMWLAVIDVDTVEVLPLSLGTLLGGALFGVAAGLSGFTPTTAFAGLGGGNAAEALCVLAGCFAGTLLLPEGLFSSLHTAEPFAAATLFQVTLDEPWLLEGGFLGQGCAGLILAAAALVIPSPGVRLLTDAEVAAQAAVTPMPALPDSEPDADPDPDPAPEAAPEPSAEAPAPEDAPAETFVALLEGEEPLVVDTAMDEEEGAPYPEEGDGDPPE